MIRILVADDEERIRVAIREYAAFEGWEVMEAADGMEAVELARGNDFDVAVLDIMMPRLDGFGLIERVRGERRHHVDRPILVLSTENADEKKARARNAGATGWVVKPFNPAKLVAAVRQVTH